MEIRPRKTLQDQNLSFKKKLLAFLILVLVIFLAYKGFVKIQNIFKNKSEAPASSPAQNTVREESQEKNEKEKFKTYTISEGDIPADVFISKGKFDANDVEAILSSAKDVYDFTHIKIGNNLRFYFNGEEKAKKMEYDRDNENIIIVERNGNDFKTHEEKINYAVSQEIARGKIENFFYVDGMDAGMSEATVLEVGDVFSFDIDFTTEIQVGDEFTVVYEKRTRDEKPAPDGKILAAKFTNSGQNYFAYYFDNNGNGGYYDNDGKLLERQFLRAPLSYRHISSGFTGRRLNPITRKISAHYQIDYAAPSGTPVVASANGTVVSVRWEGGWGNMVRLTHDNGYTTHYGHLSAFAKGLRSGAYVKRGQIIGYVGSTGWSTGPHLDYGVKLNGAPVNPLTMALPKGAPLNEESMKIFEENKKQFADMLK